MYIRIQDQTIRFRLSMAEAERVLADETLSDSLPLTADNILSYEVQPTSDHSYFEYMSSTGKLLLYINKEDLTDEISERPSKKGILFEHQVGAKKISVSLEVDLKKQR